MAVPPVTPVTPTPGTSDVPFAPAAATPAPEWQPVPQAPQPMAPVKPRSALPFVLVVLGILALIAVGLVGGMVYVGYRVKQKVTSVAKVVTDQAAAAKSARPAGDDGKQSEAGNQDASDQDASALLGNLGKLLGGGDDDDGDPVESISSKDPVEPCTPARFPDQSNARIPLKPGLVLTDAWGVKHGDVESRLTVETADAASITFSAAVDKYVDDYDHDRPKTQSTHTVCNGDYADSKLYATVTGLQPRIIHGVIRSRLSDKSFHEIAASGKTDLTYWDLMQTGEDSHKPMREGGLLTRVEPQDIAYPMIVNDQRVTLPVIHLAGVMASEGKDPRPKKYRPMHCQADVYVIDDPIDPLVLLIKLNDPTFHSDKFRIEVTKIDYPVPHPVNLVEKQLAETKKAVTWGIYFDFNKDTIKPESAPVLKDIAQAMTNNPDWKLTVAGNTDNIGGDTYNLDLSKRRAAAVKEALVSQYRIAPERLSTDGYGASHPIETNDTLEGRARNRRVELTRE